MWGLLAALWLLVLGSAGAAPAQPPDYAAGVKKMFELGLPDVRQAKYVLVESDSGQWDANRMVNQSLKISGNAWLLEARTNGSAVVVVNETVVAEVMPRHVAESRLKARLEAVAAKVNPGQPLDAARLADLEGHEEAVAAMEERSRTLTGRWQEADLKGDIGHLLEYLQQPGGRRDYEFQQSAARWFLLAAHLHSRGQSAAANQLISLLFEKAGDSRKVIGAAMSQIADEQYRKVYAGFEQGGTWAEYLSGMEVLLGRFGAAWRNAPLVERVAGLVRRQLGQKSAPALPGAGWSEEDVRIATLLGQSNAVVSQQHRVFFGPGWLASLGPRPSQRRPLGPLELIRQRGGQVVPLLAALLQDEWLVRTRNGVSQRYSSPDLDGDTLTAEEVDVRLEDFAQPWSRGQIARRILEPLVLTRDTPSNRNSKPTVDELARKSRAWAAQHKTDTRSELLRQLLGEGRREALDLLMNSPEPLDRAAVELYLMRTNKLVESLPLVTEYARQQGATVKPFLRTYVAEVTRLQSLLSAWELAHPDAERDNQWEAQRQVELKTLEDLSSDQTAEQMLREMTSPATKSDHRQRERISMALDAKLAQEDPGDALTLLLQACLRSQDDALVEALLEVAGRLKPAPIGPASSAGAPPSKPREFKVEQHAELWRQVMAQQRTTRSERQYLGQDSISFRASVASLIDDFYGGPEAPHEMARLDVARTLGAKTYEVTVQRALARLTGKSDAQLPGYPDRTKVSQERLAQIGELLRQSTQENQHEIAGRLSLDERMALPDLVAADTKLNEKLVPGSHFIQTVEMSLTDESLTRLCLALKGKALDRKSFEALRAECNRLAEQGCSPLVLVQRRVPLAGVILQLRSRFDVRALIMSPPRLFEGFPAGTRALLAASLFSEGPTTLHGYVAWAIKPAAAPTAGTKRPKLGRPAEDDLLPKNNSDMEDYVQRQEEEFWKSFERLFEPARNACQPYTCTLSILRSDWIGID